MYRILVGKLKGMRLFVRTGVGNWRIILTGSYIGWGRHGGFRWLRIFTSFGLFKKEYCAFGFLEMQVIS